MYNFQYYVPTRVVFGKAAEEETGKQVKAQNGTKVLIHYGGGSVVRSGLLDRIKKSLDEEQIAYVELGGVMPNPRLSLVYQGIDLAKKEGVDFILAVGGGSTIDSAKAIAYGVANEGDVWELFEHTKTANACLPIGVVLTIAAAGSETSSDSVITKEEGNAKRAYGSEYARPKFAIMNPELTMTLPDYQTACGCTDILMHTMERYFTNGGNMEITDSIAEGLMRTVIKNAKILHDHPQDYDARAEVMWSGSLSHNDLTGCGNDGGDFSSHMLEHEMGGMYDVAHGAGLAAIWGSWARYVYQDCLPRFQRFAVNVMGVLAEGSDEETALKGIEAMEDFYRSIDMPTSFGELGITPTEEELKELAHKCSIACGGSQGSAKVLYEEDMLAIYKMAAR
ncbi:MAG: iron-containing alcohol dehydrogenase [Hespellia sp.]|nr:iron-containing alcohol dehydrogenase [Hespellia sp.]